MPLLERPGGARLYYETHGDPNAPPIVLLEGLGGDIPGWRRNIPHLARELFVIAYDFRGNGRSDPPDEPMTMTTFVDDTVALLDELGLPKAHLYGQSFGGMVAQELVLARPERVLTLILAATHCGGRHVIRSRAAVPKGQPFLALYSEAFARAHPEHVAEDLRVGSESPQKPLGRRGQWEAMQGFDSYGRLPGIRVPTLVLHGTEDRMVDPANARILAEMIPGAELVLLKGAGHVYHSEQAEESDRAVLDFIRRHPGG
ncbi:MAG: alpha/beta hydrolase [Actinomycetota bacterium]|nr:alpha/beta hydrolase [Actinomycetota bacterium]